MKIRIDHQQTVFRITEDELNTLLSGQPLEERTLFRDTIFCWKIDLNTATNQPDLNFDIQKNSAWLILTISPKHVQQLADMGRNRDGLTWQGKTMNIVLQVDIRADKRKHKKE